MRIYKTLMNKTFIYLLITVLAACKSTPYSDEQKRHRPERRQNLEVA